MKRYTHIDSAKKDIALMVILIVLGLMAFSLFLECVWLAFKPEGRITCASFGSYGSVSAQYSAALAAFNHGAKWLDGNHDGIPCNDLYQEAKNSLEYHA